MFKRCVMVLSAATLFYLPNCAFAAEAPAPPAGATESAAAVLKQAAAGEDLATLRQTLKEKREELATLRHKWTVKKGRMPTEKEIQDFEKKRVEGKATYKDNPYVNKSALQVTFAARQAYFKKLEEVRQIEERLKSAEGLPAGSAP